MTKKQLLRDKALADIKRSKQSTFDKLPEPKTTQAPGPNGKSIEIAQLEYGLKESELELSVVFRLLPSKSFFSNLVLDLYFDDAALQSYLVRVPPSQLLSDELEFPVTLDLMQICPGAHTVKVEICERWSTGEKLTCASKYVIVQYQPGRKQDRYVKVPIVRKIDGAFRIIMPAEQELYERLEKNRQAELSTKKDSW